MYMLLPVTTYTVTRLSVLLLEKNLLILLTEITSSLIIDRLSAK